MAGLEHEPESVRKVIYGELSWIDSRIAARALVDGLKQDTALRHDLERILARTDAVTTVLVQEELLPFWDSDRDWASTLVRIMHEEYLRVPAELLELAPAELRRALGPLVT